METKLLNCKVQVLEHLVAGLCDYIDCGLQRIEQGADVKALRKVLESAQQFADQCTSANKALLAHQPQVLQLPSPVAEENAMDVGSPSGAEEETDTAEQMQPLLSSEPAQVEFKVGDVVEAYWEEEAEWFKGTISRAGVDEKVYDITYDDGDEQTNVPAQTIRLQGPPERPASKQKATTESQSGGEGGGSGEGKKLSESARAYAEWKKAKKSLANSQRQKLESLLNGNQPEPEKVQLAGCSVTVKKRAALSKDQLRQMSVYLPVEQEQLQEEAEGRPQSEIIASRKSRVEMRDPVTQKNIEEGRVLVVGKDSLISASELRYVLLESFYREVVSDGGSSSFANWSEKRSETRKRDKDSVAEYRKVKAEEAAAKKAWASEVAPAEVVAEKVQALLESSQRQGIPKNKAAKELRLLRKSKDSLTRGELLEVLPEAMVFSMRADLKVMERAAELQFDPSATKGDLFSASAQKDKVLQEASSGRLEQKERESREAKRWKEQKRKEMQEKKRIEQQKVKAEQEKKERQMARAPVEFEKWKKQKEDTEKENKKKQKKQQAASCKRRRPKWNGKHAEAAAVGATGDAPGSIPDTAVIAEGIPGTQQLQILDGELRLAPVAPDEEALLITSSV
jgi:hypothetical protein